MEFKKKTIIWEDNNEPPKNYVWVRSDENAYEFNNTTKQWEKVMSSNGSDSGDGGNSEVTLAQAWTKTFKLDKKIAKENYQWRVTDENCPLPDYVLCLSGDTYVIEQFEYSTMQDENITVPEGFNEYSDYIPRVYTCPENMESSCKIVPFNEVTDEDIFPGGNVYFLYDIDKFSAEFAGNTRYFSVPKILNYFQVGCEECAMFIKWNNKCYFFSTYAGD